MSTQKKYISWSEEIMGVQETPPYPTIGEILLSIFKFSGLWELQEGEKKTVQRRLERFAKEEQLLSKKDIEDLIASSLRGLVQDFRIKQIISNLILSILQGYTKEVMSDASYLPRLDTCRCLLKSQSILPFVMLMQKAKLLWSYPGISSDGYTMPTTPLCFLPSAEEDASLPVMNTVKWWLDEIVHKSPEKLLGEDGVVLTPRTMRNWMDGSYIPNVSYLLEIKKRDFKLESNESVIKESLLVAILLARTSHFFFDLVEQTYGKEAKRRLVDEIILLNQAFEETMGGVIKSHLAPFRKSSWETWVQEVDYFIFFIVAPIIDARLKSSVDNSGKPIQIQGSDFFSMATKLFWENSPPQPSEKIMEFIVKAEELRRKPEPRSATEIFEFENELQTLESLLCQSTEPLDYYISFLQARKHIYKSNLTEAFTLYLDAFRKGRNAAGGMSSHIVSELIAISGYIHTITSDEKQARGGYWKVMRYCRTWARLYGICDELIDDNDDYYIEKCRRYFEEKFGRYLLKNPPDYLRIGKYNALFGPETLEEMTSWKPDFRHPNRIVRRLSLRDNSQLMIAISDIARDPARKNDALRLIEKGADLNYRNSTGDTAFIYAMSGHHYDIAEVILNGNISLASIQESSHRYKNSALSMSLEHRQVKLVEKLLSLGCDVNRRLPMSDGKMITPLYLAVTSYGRPPWKIDIGNLTEWDRAKKQQKFLESPFPMPQRPEGKEIEIFQALAQYSKEKVGCDTDAFEIIQLLVKKGAVIDANNVNDHTALSLACELNLYDVAKLMLEHGADPNHRVSGGATPLFFSVINDRFDTTRLLLDCGANATAMQDDHVLLLDVCKSSQMKKLISDSIKSMKVPFGKLILPSSD